MKKSKKDSLIYQELNNNIKEPFCFLFTGVWLSGEFGKDRKRISLLIKIFLETFKNTKNPPALVLKTTQLGTSYMDRDSILKKIEKIRESVKGKNLPNIYLFHGEVSDIELNELYNHPKIKAMVSIGFGEGYGRPLLEFSLTNKPIICSGWSGPLDYLKPEFTTLIPGTLEKVHPSVANNMLLKEADWFSVDIPSVNFYLKDLFENYKSYAEKGKRQGYYSRTNFSLEKMKERLDILLNENVPNFPKMVDIKLPKLSTLPKLQLPKLNKI